VRASLSARGIVDPRLARDRRIHGTPSPESFMTFARALSVAAACAALALRAHAATFAGVDVPAPPPPKNVVDTHWGVNVDDPYRFFEDVNDPAVQAWMKAQATATERILERIPARSALLARMKEIESKASGLTDRATRSASGRYFFLKRDPKDNQFRLVWRDRPDGADHLIVDPEALAKKTGTPHAVLDFAPSPDGRRIAYAMQAGGGEIGTLHVVDLASGKEVIKPIDRIRYASVSWLDDGSGFFYSRLREGYDTLPATERSTIAVGISTRSPATPTARCSARRTTPSSSSRATRPASRSRSRARTARRRSSCTGSSATASCS
jgi:hypothetical protein